MSTRRPLFRPRKASEIDMLDGVVDMKAFNQILALDEGDSNREFSKSLVWAWCDQAESAVAQIGKHLASQNILEAANVAQFLKGSSASLGLIQVSSTCQSIFYLQPPTPPEFIYSSSQPFSTKSTPVSSDSGSLSYRSSSPSASSSSSTSRPSSPSCGSTIPLPSTTPATSRPVFLSEEMRQLQLERAKGLLADLKTQITEASDWLVRYYEGSDAYAASK